MPDHPIYSTPARYRVVEDAYIDDVYYTASSDTASVFVDYAGHPGTALQPIDDEGRRRQAAYLAMRGMTAEQALTEKRRLTLGTFDGRVLPPLPAPTPAS